MAKKIETHILRFTFSWQSCCLLDNVEKYGTARQATGGNIIQCRNDARIHIHTHTLRICNTYCFSTATMVVPVLHYMYNACFVSSSHIVPCDTVQTRDIHMSRKPQFTVVTTKHANLHFKYGSFMTVKGHHICGDRWIAVDSTPA